MALLFALQHIGILIIRVMSSTVWPSGHGCLSLKSMFTLLTAGRATRQDRCVCVCVCVRVCVCLCAVDELLNPLDTACNTNTCCTACNTFVCVLLWGSSVGIFHASGDQCNLIISIINWWQMHTHTHTLNINNFNCYIWTVFHNLLVIQYAITAIVHLILIIMRICKVCFNLIQPKNQCYDQRFKHPVTVKRDLFGFLCFSAVYLHRSGSQMDSATGACY